MAIILKSPREIALLQEANQIVARTLALLAEKIEVGCTTLYLDDLAEKYCRDNGAEPAFKGYRGFPGSLCVSINEQVVHGIPSKKVIVRDGDVVSIDFGVKYKGYYGDAAVSIPVGQVASERRSLLEVTRAASAFLWGRWLRNVGPCLRLRVQPCIRGFLRQSLGIA